MPRPKVKVHLDHGAIRDLLSTGPIRDAISGLGQEVGANIAAALPPDADVVVDDYTTDRAASSVTIRDIRGQIWHVRDGVLTRGAAQAGLEVTER